MSTLVRGVLSVGILVVVAGCAATPPPTLQTSIIDRPPASPSVGIPCSANPAGPSFPASEGGQAPSPMILISRFRLSMCCRSP